MASLGVLVGSIGAIRLAAPRIGVWWAIPAALYVYVYSVYEFINIVRSKEVYISIYIYIYIIFNAIDKKKII